MNSDHTDDVIDAPATARDPSSGRTAWDDRGNSIWEWQTAPGVYSRHADTQRVKALQIADLELVDALAPGHERVFSVSAKEYPSRVGINLPDRGKCRPESKPQRSGLMKRLIGR